MAKIQIDPDVGTRKWNKFVLVENGKVKQISDAPLTFKTSSGKRPTDAWLVQDGYYGFIDTIAPDYNKYEKKLVKTPLEDLKIDPKTNSVTQTWSVLDLDADELASMQDQMRLEVNVTREKKIAAGCSVSLDGIGVIYVRGTPEDMRNLTNLATLANLYVSQGVTTKMTFRDDKNVMYDLTPAQMSLLWQRIMGYVTRVYEHSWNIKNMNPIPQDFNEPKYWPENVI
jgi:hypothetical protein